MAAYSDDTSRTKVKSDQACEPKACGYRHDSTRKNITLRQTYDCDKACHDLMPKIGRYGHAKQYKRMRKGVKQVKGFLGRVLRDIDRQVKR